MVLACRVYNRSYQASRKSLQISHSHTFDMINKAGAMTRQLHTAEHSSFASWHGGLISLTLSFFHSDWFSEGVMIPLVSFYAKHFDVNSAMRNICNLVDDCKMAHIFFFKNFSPTGSTSHYCSLQISKNLWNILIYWVIDWFSSCPAQTKLWSRDIHSNIK